MLIRLFVFMNFRLAICLLFLLIRQEAHSQNLINNSGFDDYYNYYDKNQNLVFHPKYWYYKDSILNHPIYFSSDRYKNKSIVMNLHPDSTQINKGQNANYISLLILPNTQKAYTTLKKPLSRGKKYHLNIDVKAFSQSNYFSDLLVGFKDSVDNNWDSCLYQLRLTIPDSSCNESLYSKWLSLNVNFIAKGNEKVLIITSGSAKDYLQIIHSNIDKFLIRRYDGTPKLKYYIDNVVLVEEHVNNDSLSASIIDFLVKGESIVLQNIYFDFDKYEILEESFSELNMLYYYLDKNKEVKILISGHTDISGTNEYNDSLSARRAISITDYIVSKGIGKDRLQAKGFGSRIPIFSNETPEGRRKNRRIEMKIIK